MPAPRTGSVRWKGGEWKMRVYLPGGKEKLVPFDPPIRRHGDKDRAIAEAKAIAALAPGGFEVEPDEDVASFATVTDWAEKWVEAKRAKGQTSVPATESHLRTHVIPAIGHLAPEKVGRRDLEKLVAKLDGLVTRGELSWKSAINVWGTVTKMFDEMNRGKVLSLRVRDDNPCKDVRGPDRGVTTEQVHLYPVEFLRLAACTAVPLQRRRAYAIAIYCYLRPAELEALRWEDLDLDRETIHVRRGIDRSRGVEKTPKAGRARAPFDLEPAIVPLLRVMRDEAGDQTHVVGRLGDESALARKLRADLLAAGVDRHELHHLSEPHEAPREWMIMHGCRHTGVTWMAVRGDEPMRIMARAGHSEFSTTLGYVNNAALLRRTYGQPFPELPAALLDGTDDPGPQAGPKTDSVKIERESSAETHGNRTDAIAPRDDVTGHNAAEVEGTLDRAATRGDASRRTGPGSGPGSVSPRAALVGALADALKGAVLAGDRQGARTAWRALGELLDGLDTLPASVVDIAAARRHLPR